MVVLSGRHTWDQPVPPRYALLDQYSDHLPAGVGQEHWGLCADVEGLYVPSPRPDEFGPPMRLLGVEPQGRLRRALEIGKIKQLAGADLELLDPDGRAATGWFFQMEILGWHPSTIGRGLFDIDLRQGVWDPPTLAARPVHPG